MTILSELRQVLAETAILTAPADVAPHLTDWRGRYSGEALCVALPATTQEVAAVVKICVAHGVPVLPQGGNTSLCGGAVPAAEPRPVIINLSRMRRIRALDAANNTMVVDAGCVLATVQEAAAAAGRLYPISLGAEGSCQIGGTIATNAGGTGVLRYGNTRENILGLEVVLPDGSIWDGLYTLRKNNTGYDLKHLFIGAEGTLGIVTGAVLKLHPLPTAHAVAWLALETPEQALALLGLFQAQCSSRLSAFELINALQLQLVLDNVPGRRSPLEPGAPWHLLVELSDTGDEGELTATLENVLEQALEAGLVADAVLASSEAQRAAMWLVRHSVSEANKKAGVGLTTDCAVPVSAVPAFLKTATEAMRAVVPDLPAIVVAHMGDGNVHFIPFFTHAAWAALENRDEIAARVRAAVTDAGGALGGTFSAEHGIGQTLVPEMARRKPAVELTLMRTLKAAIDPAALFNPGKLLPPAS